MSDVEKQKCVFEKKANRSTKSIRPLPLKLTEASGAAGSILVVRCSPNANTQSTLLLDKVLVFSRIQRFVARAIDVWLKGLFDFFPASSEAAASRVCLEKWTSTWNMFLRKRTRLFCCSSIFNRANRLINDTCCQESRPQTWTDLIWACKHAWQGKQCRQVARKVGTFLLRWGKKAAGEFRSVANRGEEPAHNEH